MRRSRRVVLSVLALTPLVVLAACSSPSPAPSPPKTLWIAEQGVGVHGFSAAQRLSSGSPTPAVTIGSTDRPDGLAVDGQGDLWVGMTGIHSVVEFTPSQMTSSGTPTPAVTLGSDGTSLGDPIGLTFDAQGDLWVANGGSGTDLEMYTPSQLASSGTPTPSVSITGTYTSIVSVAFDAQGDLWFSAGGTGEIAELTPSQLSASGSPTPHVTLTSSALNNPIGLAFDAGGNLWVANLGSGTAPLQMYTAAQLASGGTPAPAVVIGDDGSGALNGPVSVALDDQGDLWEAGYGGPGGQDLVEFAAADLKASGHPAAAVVLSGFSSFNFPQMAFAPAPAKP